MIYAIISGLLYGFLGYFGLNIMACGMSVANMTCWRFIISSIFISFILIYKKDNVLKYNRRDLLKAFLGGGVFYAPSAIIYFLASEYIGTGLAMVIFFTYPIFVILLNYCVHNAKIVKNYFIAIGIIIVGIILLADIKSLNLNYNGIIFALISAIFYALYIISNKGNAISPVASTLMVSIGSAFTAALLSLKMHDFIIPTNLHEWGNVFAIGTICTSLPILFFLKSTEYISYEKASILSVLEPVFVVIIGVIMLDEDISLMQVIGIILVLSGALVSLLKPKLSEKEV